MSGHFQAGPKSSRSLAAAPGSFPAQAIYRSHKVTPPFSTSNRLLFLLFSDLSRLPVHSLMRSLPFALTLNSLNALNFLHRLSLFALKCFFVLWGQS